jgi:hypothetical protein
MIPWSRARLRVRTILVVMAGLGLSMGLAGMYRRRALCLARAYASGKIPNGDRPIEEPR